MATVAVYSDVDANALHVELADEARRIGPASAEASYLNIDAIIDATRASGAEAIHPGYGFLAESPRLAKACADAGLVFIGPPAEAMAAMGSKIEAKAIMEAAGIPVVPGYHDDKQDDETFLREADGIGYPLLIKASAGGGGKGMRIVEDEKSLKTALEGARREAHASFGDDSLLLEKYLPRCRHVEIQVFADSHGNALHLFERDCSTQRRHQKIIEEAPAPHLPDELRRRMSQAAVEAARAIGYVGAGTVECLVADHDFYFIEMNTRLQVEHPVTEMVTGLDLVEWQLRVACGDALPCSQNELRSSGHAIEARLYAEHPAGDFLPSTGRIIHLHLPEPTDDIRLDMGIVEGTEVTRHYDPLLGKLIAHGNDRDSAVRALQRALAEVQIAGLRTNVDLLQRIAAHPDFLAGEVSTDLILRHEKDLLDPGELPCEVAVLAAAWSFLKQEMEARQAVQASADPWSPWGMAGSWRLNGLHRRRMHFVRDDVETTVEIGRSEHQLTVSCQGRTFTATARLDSGRRIVLSDGARRLTADVVASNETLSVFHSGRSWELSLQDPLSARTDATQEQGAFRAPMPGRVLEVRVREGDKVHDGMALIVLEAMKMEHTITAHGEGTVQSVGVRVDDLVDEGTELLVVETGTSGED